MINVNNIKGRLTARVKGLTTKRLHRKTNTTFKHISAAAVKWKQQSRKFLGKPRTTSKNTSKYPRKRTGQLQNSIYYKIQKHIGKTTGRISVFYGFKEVYSKHNKSGPPFPYGSYLNEAPATYGGYRERLESKLIARIQTVLSHSTI